MVGERPRRRLMSGYPQVILRPGPYVVCDRAGRRFTTTNHLPYAQRLARDLGGQVAIQCPRCEQTSYHPDDVKNGYCGRCHWWTSDPAGILNTLEAIAQAEADGAITSN